ncbi:hypothetical protein AWB69_09010 [Caballeronia udeis]|uniref:Uncharacterized protein n=1 Tax=Caballeronia udeis TaxID=1232866 RepID=A0A158JYN2_9BURK|nr:hypothetical protein [Caballeronia udeis]SAL73451.1 hypothetical protein AWB69_09010 [Caballeronia udeis]
MLRHITATTRTVLAITTLTGIVAINQAVTSHRSPVSAPTQTTLTDDAGEPPMDAANAPLSSLQLAVLLEGFNCQALNDAAQSAYAHTP